MSNGSNAAQIWFIAGAIPILVAGGGHALLTLVDVVRPTYFTPEAPWVRPELESTGMRFRSLVPGGDRSRPSLWRAWLGFNISHGLGAFAFGLLVLLVAVDEPELLERSQEIALAVLALSATYLLVALRFWFWLPALVVATSTSCFAIATLQIL